MSKNNIDIDDFSACNCHSSCESRCKSENKFCFKIDDTLNEDFLKLKKELSCELISINNELSTLKLLILLLIIFSMCHRVNC